MIVAQIGTAMLRSTQAGNHGNRSLTSAVSLTGAMVPAKRNSLFTFVIVALAAQNANNNYGHDNDKYRGNNRNHKVQVCQDNLDGIFFGNFTGRRNST